MDQIIKNNRSLELVTSRSSGYKKKFRKIPLLGMYYLTKFDDVIWSGFWVIPTITSANLCKPVHDIINYFIFICPFESGKCEKEGKKLQKLEYLQNERLSSFWRTHCVKSSQIRSFSCPNTGKYGPEKTPYLDTFHTVVKSVYSNNNCVEN